MSIKSELLNIQHATPDNVLHAADVIEWAKEHTESSLHRAIEWNDAKAAHDHRLWQVRQLIALHIVTDDGTPMVVSLSIDRKAAGGYRDLNDVAARPDLREIMLQDALDELERVQVKYQRVQELNAVWVEADRVKASVPSRSRRRARETVTA